MQIDNFAIFRLRAAWIVPVGLPDGIWARVGAQGLAPLHTPRDVVGAEGLVPLHCLAYNRFPRISRPAARAITNGHSLIGRIELRRPTRNVHAPMTRQKATIA